MPNDPLSWSDIRALLDGESTLPPEVCRAIGSYFNRTEGPALRAAKVPDDLGRLIERISATQRSLSADVDALDRHDGSTVVPTGDLRDWLLDFGTQLNHVAFGIAKLHPTNAEDMVLLDHVEAVDSISQLMPLRPWSPFAVLTKRSVALVASKQNRFGDAWRAHDKARETVLRHLSETNLPPEIRAMLEQAFSLLLLSETGTGCRELEYYVAQGAEFTIDDPAQDLDALLAKIPQINRTMASASSAIAIIDTYKASHGLAAVTSREAVLTVGSYRQPGVMGARASQLKFILCEAMVLGGVDSDEDGPSWSEQRAVASTEFERFYRFAEDPSDLRPVDGELPAPIKNDHCRSLVQLRLGAALLAPHVPFPSRRDSPACLARQELDDETVALLCAALYDWHDDAGNLRAADANAIGTSISVWFNVAIASCRASTGTATGVDYFEWRRRNPGLDQRARDPGRAQLVGRCLERCEALFARECKDR